MNTVSKDKMADLLMKSGIGNLLNIKNLTDRRLICLAFRIDKRKSPAAGAGLYEVNDIGDLGAHFPLNLGNHFFSNIVGCRGIVGEFHGGCCAS